jgi:hypothetical protein
MRNPASGKVRILERAETMGDLLTLRIGFKQIEFLDHTRTVPNASVEGRDIYEVRVQRVGNNAMSPVLNQNPISTGNQQLGAVG